MFKFNIKDTWTMPLASFWCLYCWLWTNFTLCSRVSIVNFEQINTGCVVIILSQAQPRPAKIYMMESFATIINISAVIYCCNVIHLRWSRESWLHHWYWQNSFWIDIFCHFFSYFELISCSLKAFKVFAPRDSRLELISSITLDGKKDI